MSDFKKNILLLRTAVVILFSLVIYFSNTSDTKAVSCNETEKTEFHSLRPYQASPCNKTKDSALYCGNDLVIQDTVQGSYSSQNPNCQSIGEGKVKCNFTVNPQEKYAIDISDVEFPIAGRTQDDVINSQQQSVDIPDAQKVNEYISWYLNGAINRAEYPPLSFDNLEDIFKLINFAGPLNKLLPWEIQANVRNETVKKAGATRHDQIVACTYGIPVKLFGIIEIGSIGKIPGQCYMPGLASLVSKDETFRDKKRLSGWKDKLAPLPSDKDASGEKKYKNFHEWWIAYNEWRGKDCGKITIPEQFLGVDIPIIGGKSFMACIDNPLSPNFYADLFPYIPYSSTEDSKGSLKVTSGVVQSESEDMTVSNVVVKSKPSDLFFAHQEENDELASLLQKTYVAKENIGQNAIDYSYVDIQGADHCNLAKIRSNPGDDLFAGEISIDLSYTVNFSCEFQLTQTDNPTTSYGCSHAFQGGGICYPKSWGCSGSKIDCPNDYVCLSSGSCQSPAQELSCEKTANVYLSTITETPKADSIWQKLVAGSSSVFKRWFPKMGEGGPVDAVLDMPAASKVTYKTKDGTPLQAVNPANRISQSPELYFPHLGGVQEYFIKAVQTALRPKGYGYDISSGKASDKTSSSSGLCESPATPPDAGGAQFCEMGVGYCSPSNLRRFFPDERSARQASIICNAESGGDPSIINCGCISGKSYDYSIGLFQINLLAHCAKGNGFQSTRNPTSCTIINEDLVNSCSEKYFDADENIKYAVELYNQSGWNPWSTYLLSNNDDPPGCREQIEAQQ